MKINTMREITLRRSWTFIRHFWIKVAKFICHHWIGVFRSALFLASLMVLFGHFPVFEWLNIVMFRVLHTVAYPTMKIDDAKSDTGAAKALVFTIQQELFETQFRSRSPIDRSVLLESGCDRQLSSA